jgi:hypothetical protein
VPVSHVDEVIGRALVRKLEAIEWEEPPEPVTAPPAARPTAADGGGVATPGGVLPH